MSETSTELVRLAREVADTLRKIVEGKVKPYDKGINMWATAKFVELDTSKDDPLAEAVEDSLVDIMSCEDEPWDTPMRALEEDLKKLGTLLKEL